MRFTGSGFRLKLRGICLFMQTWYAGDASYGHYVDNNPTLTNDCNSLLYSAVLPRIASVLTD